MSCCFSLHDWSNLQWLPNDNPVGRNQLSEMQLTYVPSEQPSQGICESYHASAETWQQHTTFDTTDNGKMHYSWLWHSGSRCKETSLWDIKILCKWYYLNTLPISIISNGSMVHKLCIQCPICTSNCDVFAKLFRKVTTWKLLNANAQKVTQLLLK